MASLADEHSAVLWRGPGRDGGMAVSVEQRDGFLSCSHPFDRVVGIKLRLAGEHRAGNRQQAVGDAAQRTAVAVTAFAQFGIAMPAELIVLDGNARPVIDGGAQPPMAGLAHDDDAALAAALGHWGNAG